MENSGMNREYGRKWFTFYTKFRPWLACFMFIMPVANFAQYSQIYFRYWWLLLSFVASAIEVVLGIMVFNKSKGNYDDFLPFVKNVIIFETFNFPYQQAVKIYLDSFNHYPSPAQALIVFIILLAITYFVWYRMNVKYFEKRSMQYAKMKKIREKKQIDKGTIEEMKFPGGMMDE